MLYRELTDTYEKLASSSARLEKTYYVMKLLENTKKDDLAMITNLVSGKIFPDWDERKLGVAARLVIKAISLSTGFSIKKIESEWKKTGDLGDVAVILSEKRVQSTLVSKHLEIGKVFTNLKKLADLAGTGTVDRKVKIICELLANAVGNDSKYIVRTILEELRVGVGEGSVRDALVWLYFPKIVGIFYRCKNCQEWMPKIEKCLSCGLALNNKFKDEVKHDKIKTVETLDQVKKLNLKVIKFILAKEEETARKIYEYFIEMVQSAYNIKNDYGLIAELAAEDPKKLTKVEIKPGSPIKVMLAQKVKDMKEGFKKVETPCALEYKYDGFRIQCHKSNNKISLFTRRLENVTKQFPDVVSNLKEHIKSDSYILDAEAVGFNPKTTQYLPFQFISQRIRRKYDTHAVAKKIPVELNIFDVIYLNKKSMIKEPFAKRRKALSAIIEPSERKIVLSRIMVTADLDEAKKFYHSSLDAGNEGLILKNLEKPYKPGSRVGYMIKLKPVMESLDLVITGATWGEGKRAKWLTSFMVSCIDENQNYLEIGRVGTGIKELAGEGVTFEELTTLLEPVILAESGKEVKVKAKIVLEIHYEEIQKSSTYKSGFALRFPRVKVIRNERGPQDISTLEMVEELYFQQRT